MLSSETDVTDKPLLVVGVDGLLGGALRRFWWQQGRRVVGTRLQAVVDTEDIHYLDLCQPPETWPSLPPCRAAILCAAITNLEQCRRDPSATRHINVTQTLELARRLIEQGSFVTFISSNLVFDGTTPWRKSAEPTCPKTEYGRQKAEAEAGLANFSDVVGIVRLTKVFHAQMPLIRGWVKSLHEGKPIHPFADFVCSPISFEATVRTIATVTEKRMSGLWQLSGSGDISYAHIATHIATRHRCDPSLIQPTAARDTLQFEHLPVHTTLDASTSREQLAFHVLDPLTVIDHIFCT